MFGWLKRRREERKQFHDSVLGMTAAIMGLVERVVDDREKRATLKTDLERQRERTEHFVLELGVITGKHQAVEAHLDALHRVLGEFNLPVAAHELRSELRFGIARNLAGEKKRTREGRDRMAALLFPGSPPQIPDAGGLSLRDYDADREGPMAALSERIAEPREIEEGEPSCQRCKVRQPEDGRVLCNWCLYVVVAVKVAEPVEMPPTLPPTTIPVEPSEGFRIEARDEGPGETE